MVLLALVSDGGHLPESSSLGAGMFGGRARSSARVVLLRRKERSWEQPGPLAAC